MSQNVAESMFSLSSQSCGNSLMAVYLSRQDGVNFKDHLCMSDRLVNEALVKPDCLKFWQIAYT